MNEFSERRHMGGMVTVLIGTLAWTGTPVGSEPLETGRRDINLEPVKVTEDTTVEDLLPGIRHHACEPENQTGGSPA